MLTGRMGETGLLMAISDRRTGWTGWGRGGMEGSEIAGSRLGARPLALEVRWAEADTTFISFAGDADYLCQQNKIIITRCT